MRLSDWSTSTTLDIHALVEGCFTVGVEPYIFYGRRPART